MKNLFRVAVLLSLPLFAISACKKEEAAKPAALGCGDASMGKTASRYGPVYWCSWR